MIGKAVLWGVIGMVAGGWLGAVIIGPLGLCIAGPVIGLIAFMSSYKNGGRPPKWLWRSKKKADPGK